MTWHTSASLVVPSITIHTFVNTVSKIPVFKTQIPGTKEKILKSVPSILGLGLIPFIIHPIDHGTDYVMDKFIRPFYK